MEVCGGQTHTLIRQGIDQLLDGGVELVHGPGCPVCVTPLALIDEAIAIAKRPGRDRLLVRRHAARPRLVARTCSWPGRPAATSASSTRRSTPSRSRAATPTGPSCSSRSASRRPRRRTRWRSCRPSGSGSTNFALLVAHVLVPPAIMAILVSPGNRVQGFLAPGHVCAIQGWTRVRADRPGLRRADRRHGVRAARPARGHRDARDAARRGPERGREPVRARRRREGNPAALDVVNEVFEVADRAWRGIGVIPAAGCGCREAYRAHDAEVCSPARAASRQRVRDLHRRRGAAGPREAARLPRVRRRVHARVRSARRWSRARARAPPTSSPAAGGRRPA